MLLSLKFFEKNPENEIKLSSDAVFTSSGCGFLYVADSNGAIYQFDHSRKMIRVESYLDHISYMKSSATTQDLFCSCISGHTITCVLFNALNFSSKDPKNGEPFVFPNRTKGNANISIICASQNLQFACYSSVNNEVFLFKAPYTTRSRPFINVQVNDSVTNLILGDDGSLFVTTNTSVLKLAANNKTLLQIDDVGVSSGNAFLSADGFFVVSRQKALTFYHSTNNHKLIHELESIPRKVGTSGSYVYSAFPTNVSSSFLLMDIANGLLVFSTNLGNQVAFVEHQWRNLIIITIDGTIKLFQELKPILKIDLLCKSQRFDLAITMAQHLNLGNETEAMIQKKYGDHLFSQHNFEESIQHYIKTIGYTEPSQIISKFVEPHHASHLAQYLVSIPKHLCTHQHTTLLFNCYTKVKATGQLDKIVNDFVQSASKSEPMFDIEAAVDVLQKNGYKHHAESIAKAYSYHSLYLQLLYEGEPKFNEILEHISILPGELVLSKLLEYGVEIMDKYPEGQEKLIQFAVICCTNGIQNTKIDGITKIDPGKLAPMFLNNNEKYFSFLNSVLSTNPSILTDSSWDILVEIGIRINTPNILDVLKHPNAQYSKDQALVLACGYNNYLAKMYLFECLELYPSILKESPPNMCLEICQKYGEKNPSLWNDALIQLSETNCDYHIIQEFLVVVQKNNYIPLTSILQTMKNGKKHKFAAIKNIVKCAFAQEQTIINNTKKRILENRVEAENAQKVINQLSNHAFSIKRNRCEACGGDIDSDSQHFYCGHSFHINCLGDSTDFCPKCKPDFEEITSKKISRTEMNFSNAGIENEISKCGGGFEFLINSISNSLFELDIASSEPILVQDVILPHQEFLKKLQS